MPLVEGTEGPEVTEKGTPRRHEGTERVPSPTLSVSVSPRLRDVLFFVPSAPSASPPLPNPHQPLGLPGARRLMDEFQVASEPGRGTTVTMTKWRQER